VLDLADQHYPLYPIERLFPPRFASDEQFAAELERRLKKIPYPYEPTRAQSAQSQSTFELLDKLGALPSIVEPSLISQLKIWANGPEYSFGFRQIHSSSTAHGQEFRKFHVSLAKELTRHTAAVRKLKEAYQLGDEWIGPYLRTAEERLMVEAALLHVYTEVKQDSDSKATRESVRMVYSLVSRALKTSKVSNDALCHHLTSIICSSNCLTTGVLSPSPGSVRKRLARNPVKKPAKSSN
jgi:hypothetical protein